MWAMSQNQAARTRPGGLISSQPPSVVFSKCTFFGGRLGQRQRLVPVPHQCHQGGMGTELFAVPKSTSAAGYRWGKSHELSLSMPSRSLTGFGTQ